MTENGFTWLYPDYFVFGVDALYLLHVRRLHPLTHSFLQCGSPCPIHDSHHFLNTDCMCCSRLRDAALDSSRGPKLCRNLPMQVVFHGNGFITIFPSLIWRCIAGLDKSTDVNLEVRVSSLEYFDLIITNLVEIAICQFKRTINKVALKKL